MAVGATLGIVGGMLTTSVAHAQQRQDFGQQGEFIISADRLFSLFSFSSVTVDNVDFGGRTPVVNGTITNTRTGMSLLWGANGAGIETINGDVFPAAETFFTVPRVGFDYIVVPNVTIGGDLALYFTLGGHTKTETTTNNATFTATVDAPSTTVFGLAPRAGYVLGINNLLSIWLRGGLSFYTANVKAETQDNRGNVTSTTTNNVHQFALDLDPQLVISPLPHMAFTAGLTMDIPLAGGASTTIQTTTNNAQSTNEISYGSSIWYLGLTAGMLVYF